MTRLQARFRTIIGRYGDLLGTAPAVIASVTPGRARTYVSDADLDSAVRPIWIAYAGHDHPASEGQTLAWGARSVLVKRTIDVRFGGNTVARLLVLFTATSVPGEGEPGPLV
ncbi:hypothetical protein EON82_13020 [bacterium]|nr:MAG: hypothetical protein EON82_13020 [bacterium]